MARIARFIVRLQCVVSSGSGGVVPSSATFFRSSPNGRTTWVAIGSQHDLIVGRRADDQVRQLEALLLQAQGWASASLRISSRMAAPSCMGISKFKPIERPPSTFGVPHSHRNRQCKAFFRLPAQLPRALSAPCRDNLGTRSALGPRRQRRRDGSDAGRACHHILGKPQAGLISVLPDDLAALPKGVTRRDSSARQRAANPRATMVRQGGIRPVISRSTFKGCDDRVEPLGRLYVPR